MPVSRSRVLPALALAMTLPALPVLAQDAQPAPPAPIPAPVPAEKKVDPAAKQAIDDMAKAHQTLKSFSATMKFSIQAGDKTQNVTEEIAYALPNKIQAITSPPATPDGKTTKIRAVSDGKTLYMVNSSTPNTYQSKPAAPDIKNIAAGLSMSGAGTGLLRLLLTTSPASDKVIGNGATDVALGPNETVEGVDCRIINITVSQQGKPLTIALASGKDDNLLRRVVINQSSPQGTFVVTETYSDVKVNPELPDTLFAYTPPPGAKPQEEKEEAYFDARLKVGAIPLPFSGKDMTGKPITLAAYKGKVVLLDFWATWCGPCVAELPNVISVYNKYHANGFDVVGVSLDQPGDKEKVLSFLKENKMPWPQIYDGKGWESSLATAYSIKAIPFTLLIGKDGKIAAVGARGEELEPAVKKALAAK